MTSGQQFTLELLKMGKEYVSLLLPALMALLAPSPIQHLFKGSAQKEDPHV